MLKDIRSMDLAELTAFVKELGEPSFRAKQIFSWLHQKRVYHFDEMSDLPLSLREKLKDDAVLLNLTIEKKMVSALDQTIKYLFRLPDGEYVETVRMRYAHGNSLCLSCQVGCKMGCRFCASTKAGYKRDLLPSEMLEQVYQVIQDTKEPIHNLVLMGIGEPLDNYQNVLRFLSLVSSKDGLNIGYRHISLSTCGLVPMIDRLAEENLQLTLSVSLHASDNETRDEIMPVNHRYPIEALLQACDRYTEKTHRRISYEYALIQGVNDSEKNALALARLLRGKLCHVNLIPVNYVKEAGYRKSGKQQLYAFQKVLTDHHINATIRRTLGADISAACGQLRREANIQTNEHRGDGF